MIFASGAFTACAVTAFQPKKVTGAVTVKVYQMAWLEHVITNTVLSWDKRKAHLSNSAGGNAKVVNGLHQVAEGAVAQAIQDFKPKYDADAQAWVWGEHGLMCPHQAFSVLGSQTNMGAKFIVDVNIALFIFTVTNVPSSPLPVFSNSSYHTNAGHLVATFACVPKPITFLNTYLCTTSSLANITVPFRPVNRPKALVDAGFSNPSGFYSTISVNGVTLRGGITASVANL
ncbi:unnamed protein product [Closterium sp. NIES-64]|nr:unnamed protein product [Closterium sp. NIES-64]